MHHVMRTSSFWVQYVSLILLVNIYVWLHIRGCKCYTANSHFYVSMCVKGTEKGGRDSHQREEAVGRASSFIAALMSPGTHRLETAVLFPPPTVVNKFSPATDTQKHMYIQRRTYNLRKDTTYCTSKQNHKSPHTHTHTLTGFWFFVKHTYNL